MTDETAEVAGLATVNLPDGRVFKEQGRFVLTQRKWHLSGAGYIRTVLDCEPGTVVEVRIQDYSLQALIIEVDRLVSRFIVNARIIESFR